MAAAHSTSRSGSPPARCHTQVARRPGGATDVSGASAGRCSGVAAMSATATSTRLAAAARA
ncbi:hypothetical protein, partial [Dactylosporangium sucinum]|uniref:hypothetical protein n=1 Tax=Dactylosporangium sucinum TaxID=1424081 RepID=UPI001E64935C